MPKENDMNLRTLSLALALVLIAAFAFLNWSAISTPGDLSLGFVTLQAPLGLVMLAMTVLVSALFLIYIAYQQAGVILEARRYAKELKSHRELADQAEASRFTALQTYLADELRRLDAQRASESDRMTALVAQLERRIADKLDESTRSFSAVVGEIEDKLDRALASRQA
jgi:uncharacterized integral membrane protein